MRLPLSGRAGVHEVSTMQSRGPEKGALRKPRSPGASRGYRIDLGVDDAGKRRQRQVGNFATKREAQAALNEALAGLQKGTYVTPSKQTVRDFLETWIDTVKPELALTAWTNHREVLENSVMPHIGSIRLAELSPMDLKRWHGVLLDHGRRDGTPLAANSVKLAHRVLHRTLADAVRWNVMPANPASSVRVPKGEHQQMSVWTSDEARRFLDSLAEDRLRGLWALAPHTGTRRGELAGLRWSDMDLDEGTLTVSQQRTTAGSKTVTTTPKARSQRQLLLADPTVALLREHLDRQVLERATAGVAWIESGYVFVDESGEPLLPQRLTKMFAAAIARAGVPKIRLHDVRHTLATNGLAAGVHPKVVQEQLGHATIAVTMDIYSHVPQAVRRDGAGPHCGPLRVALSVDRQSTAARAVSFVRRGGGDFGKSTPRWTSTVLTAFSAACCAWKQAAHSMPTSESRTNSAMVRSSAALASQLSAVAADGSAGSVTLVQATAVEDRRPFDGAGDPGAFEVALWVGERHVERCAGGRDVEGSNLEIDGVASVE